MCHTFFIAFTQTIFASETNGTIDSIYKYAWSNQSGYVNFAPASGGVEITDSQITGWWLGMGIESWLD